MSVRDYHWTYLEVGWQLNFRWNLRWRTVADSFCCANGSYSWSWRRMEHQKGVERGIEWGWSAEDCMGKIVLSQTQGKYLPFWSRLAIINPKFSVCRLGRSDVVGANRNRGPDDGICNPTRHYIADCVSSTITLEVPHIYFALWWSGWLCFVCLVLFLNFWCFLPWVQCSTKLDAEKRLELQEEKQALETKLLEVWV